MSAGLYCIELRTANWEQSVDWYRNVLGLRVLVRVAEDGYALIEAGETRLSIIRRDKPGPKSPRWSLAFEVENLDLAAARLQQAGASNSRPKTDAEGLRDIITEDPDGNRIRIFAWPEDRRS